MECALFSLLCKLFTKLTMYVVAMVAMVAMVAAATTLVTHNK